MLDVGLYQLDRQVACQRIDKILDVKTSIRERLVAMVDSIMPKTFAPALA